MVTLINTQRNVYFNVLKHEQKLGRFGKGVGSWNEAPSWVGYSFYTLTLRQSTVNSQHRTVQTHTTFSIEKLNERAQESQRRRAQNSEPKSMNHICVRQT